MKNDNLNLAKSLKMLLAQLQGSIDGNFSKYAYMSIEDALADAFKDLEGIDGAELVPFSVQ